MTIPSSWRGYPQHHAVPGAYVVRRRVVVTSTTFVEVNLRTDTWFGACPLLSAAEKVAATARGVLKRVAIVFPPASEPSVTADQLGHRLDFAEASDAAATSLTGYYSSVSESRGLSVSYATRLERSSWWWRAVDDQVVVEVEVYFDIPPEA